MIQSNKMKNSEKRKPTFQFKSATRRFKEQSLKTVIGILHVNYFLDSIPPVQNQVIHESELFNGKSNYKFNEFHNFIEKSPLKILQRKARTILNRDFEVIFLL